MPENRQILINSLPEGKLEASNFRLEATPIPAPDDGEVLCRTLLITVGAGRRAYMRGSAPNDIMAGPGIARVTQSNSPDYKEGDLVYCLSGWQDYSVHKPEDLTRVSDDINLAYYLGAIGNNGLTAYFGLLEVGEPKPGHTVVVSSAAGSVGHLVGQMAKIKGCRTVGITSTPEKCRLLEDRFGYDASVSYRSEDFQQELKAACPDGIDIYFDNTGGDILAAALRQMNKRGRIVCCGAVSQYDTGNTAARPSELPVLLQRHLIGYSLRIEGFLVSEFTDRFQTARDEIKSWILSGKLNPLIDEYRGLENAPSAFVDLLAGGNIGTRMVRIAE